MDTSSPTRTGAEGLGFMIALAALGAGLTAFRYAPWLLGAIVPAGLLTAVIVAVIPHGTAGRAAAYAVVVALIAAAPAAAAIANDYQHSTTRQVLVPAKPTKPTAGTHGRRASDRRDTSRAAASRGARRRRVTVRSGFLPTWNPTRQVLGPFHPSALTRWWALTASVITALTALLTAALLAAVAAYTRRRASAGRHASWPQIGHSSRTWRPS